MVYFLRCRIALAVAGLMCTMGALASAQTAEQRGKQIVDDAIAALGGQKFLTMEDRVETGRAYSFYRERLSGLSIATIYTRYISIPPGKSGQGLGLRERQAFGKKEDSFVLFREDGAWDVSWRGSKDLSKDRIERYRDSTVHNVFYILRQRLHEPGLIFEARGFDVWENQPVNIVEITDSENRVVTVYFHQSTKLPVRQMYSWRDPQTRERNDEETRFARYREVNGVQWPHQITRERNGEKIYQMFADSVMVNQDLTDNLFSLPANGKTR